MIEFENVFESELVAALYKALHFAKADNAHLVGRLEQLIVEAEQDEENIVVQ